MNNAELSESNEPQSNTLDIANIADKPVYDAIHNYLQAASGNHKETARQPGLYLVQEDLQKVKRFCRHVSQLPVNHHEVISYLGYSESFIPGLKPSRIAELHRQLKETADIWFSIETRMIGVGSTLVSFSGDLSSFGAGIIDLIRTMDSYRSHQGLVGDVTAAQLNSLPDIPLQDSDLRALPSLSELCGELVMIVEGHKKEAQKVKLQIEFFRSELRSARDNIARKIALSVEHDGNDKLSELSEEITRYNNQIEEVGRTYRTYTRNIWVGAWWGPVGAIIAGGIYGYKAYNTKKDHNKLIQEKKDLEEKLTTISKATRSLLALETDLQNMLLLTEEALSGAGNLENIWTVIAAYITASIQRIKTTSSATTLFLFEARLSHMITQWSNVEREARTLMQAINQDSEEALRV